MEDFKVLLVDDEVEFVTTLAERLQLRGINSIVATDGEEALRKLYSEKPEIVVLDLLMPGIGGLEILRRIKQERPETQVILLTGKGSVGEGIESMQMGAFDYIMKPINIDDLIDKMKAAARASCSTEKRDK